MRLACSVLSIVVFLTVQYDVLSCGIIDSVEGSLTATTDMLEKLKERGQPELNR